MNLHVVILIFCMKILIYNFDSNHQYKLLITYCVYYNSGNFLECRFAKSNGSILTTLLTLLASCHLPAFSLGALPLGSNLSSGFLYFSLHGAPLALRGVKLSN